MTGTYDWNPMPHKVNINCPSCGNPAIFEFAEIVEIQKKDISFFEKSKLFDYEVFKDLFGHKWHGAIFYAGLHGGSVKAIHDLPEGYSPENWNHSQYLYRSHNLDIGSVHCTKCHMHEKHTLSWPEEVYFSISYKGQQAWAYDRESAVELRDYVLSSQRNPDDYKWRNFLLHIPSVFLKRSARERIANRLNLLLR